jgi:hypothetical protein
MVEGSIKRRSLYADDGGGGQDCGGGIVESMAVFDGSKRRLFGDSFPATDSADSRGRSAWPPPPSPPPSSQSFLGTGLGDHRAPARNQISASSVDPLETSPGSIAPGEAPPPTPSGAPGAPHARPRLREGHGVGVKQLAAQWAAMTAESRERRGGHLEPFVAAADTADDTGIVPAASVSATLAKSAAFRQSITTSNMSRPSTVRV